VIDDKCQAGFAHLLTLLVTLLLSAIAAAFVVDARHAANMAFTEISISKVRHLADGAIYRRAFRLAQALASDRERLRNFVSDKEEYTPAASASADMNETVITVSVVPATIRVDLNAAPITTIERVFIEAGESPLTARALARQIDLYRRRDGYRPDETMPGVTLSMRGGRDGKAFDTVSELLFVEGINERVYTAVYKKFTVYGKANARSDTTFQFDGTAIAFEINAQARNYTGNVFKREAIVSFPVGNPLAFKVLRWRQGEAGQD
jgi:type II secretory pathway component PulK